MSAAARQGDVGAAGGRKHETAYRMAPSIRAALVAWTVSASPSKRFVNVMSVPLVAEMFVSTGQETRTTVGSCRPLMEVLFR